MRETEDLAIGFTETCAIIVCTRLSVFTLSSSGDIWRFEACLSKPEPAIIDMPLPIVQMSAGNDFVLFLDFYGNVWALGNDFYGAIGIKRQFSLHTAKLVPLPRISSVVCGGNHSICIPYDNSNLFTFGMNSRGQLGVGHTEKCVDEIKQANLSKVRVVECGQAHSIAITKTGKILACGSNEHGQLGLGNEVLYHTLFTTIKWHEKTHIISISCGNNHTLLLTGLGHVYSCGDNQFGQIGHGRSSPAEFHFKKINKFSDIRRIAASSDHSLCIGEDLWVFGRNDFGQLGFDDTTNRYTPVKVDDIQGVECCGTGFGNFSIIKRSRNEEEQILMFGLNSELDSMRTLNYQNKKTDYYVRSSLKLQFPMSSFCSCRDDFIPNSSIEKQRLNRECYVSKPYTWLSLYLKHRNEGRVRTGTTNSDWEQNLALINQKGCNFYGIVTRD